MLPALVLLSFLLLLVSVQGTSTGSSITESMHAGWHVTTDINETVLD
ncbi:predicted protein [Plenodomus lingam JN3]|uniref:Predicted protein n=1 Tax=Leptosphaeria maculans (strain JN3 / isolate v23.1.3 / race Av1-4-5-6-7-8) TaxID=985895 RepID=E5ACU2_LEPMJ|nr:predicted protein [Plenodomus lingam JN3]CBY02294.1 predicted protein [Plenodomus lingam JN3]